MRLNIYNVYLGGGIIATVTAGRILDWQFQRVKRNYEQERNADSEKNGKSTRNYHLSQDGYGEFPIEKATMQSQHVWYLLFSVCTIGYGWSLESKTSMAVPLILQFFCELQWLFLLSLIFMSS